MKALTVLFAFMAFCAISGIEGGAPYGQAIGFFIFFCLLCSLSFKAEQRAIAKKRAKSRAKQLKN